MEEMAQGIGKEHFNLLEVVMRDDERPKGGETLYIGEGERDRVKYIKDKIDYEDLTGNAEKEIDYVLPELIKDQEEKFIKFFNESAPVTPRRHALELLPGIGNKHMQKILDEREEGEFENFEDLEDRVPSLPNPINTLQKRIKEELKGETKRQLFVGQ
ncbi:MAG: DUF655 domain-containing protein [Candidatus Nanohaloarchaea archaeon]